jgi:hypothetical protein
MKSQAIIGISVGAIISLPWLAIMYAGQAIAGLPFLPFDLFEWLTRFLPGGVITLGIELLIQFVSTLQLGQTSTVGKSIEIIIAYLLALVLLSGTGGLYAVSLRRLKAPWWLRGTLVGIILTLLAAVLANWGGWGSVNPVIGNAWLLITSLAWGIGLAWGVDSYINALAEESNTARRRVIGQLTIGSLALSMLAIGLGRRFIPQPEPAEVAQGLLTPDPTTPLPTRPPSSTGFEPVPGTRPEITPIEDFYRVDINLLPPGDEEFLDSSDPFVQRLLAQGGDTDLPASTYLLPVDGLVRNPLLLSLNDLEAYPKIEQFATLACISNPVGGDLIDTTLFEGARLKDVLEDAGLEPGVVDIKFTGVDGYSESLPIQSALHDETLLCYAMGGQPLSKEHGSPLRLYTPNRFGMKNPKWIIKIEAIDSAYEGFWEKRGWSEDAWVRTTTVIDTIITDEANLTQVGGMAFSGARGIQSVELSVDDGIWMPVELDRPVSPLTWVLWRANLDLAPGKHLITVRAVDGEGNTQTGESSGSHPSGATGYHKDTVTIEG